jgi:seryl-tRNA synthetase
MSRDFDDIYKKIDQSHKELYKKDSEALKDIEFLKKDQDKMIKDISDIKKQIKDISFKVDMVLEILNNFTIMLAEDEEDLEENYDFDNDTDETWVPKEENFWEDDDEA